MPLRFLTFILIFFFCYSLSQNITVKVKDNTGKSVADVNVQLLKNGKTIDFQKTNDTGHCTFQLSEKGVFSLKFTSVFYKTKVVEIDTNQQSEFNIELEQQITEIKEVEIKSRPKIASAKQDTVAFNLKAVRDGTERTTEDLIKKLPGLDINDNGKVTYKGNTIGQVLVEGNEFFGKNHKMATQNISANMIEGIDLWQNFNTINGNRSTALNLKLKSEYKGKITGNIEGNYGIKNSYLGHTNLFKFGKSGNLALVADVNNIARDPINFMDFYEMNTQEDIDNSESTNNIDIPSFLNNDGKVKSKSNQFGALQYSKSKKNFSITAFSILNNAQLEKYSTIRRIPFENQPLDFNYFEQKKEDNKGYFGITQIKIKRTFSDNSFLYYNFGYNPTEDIFKQNTDRYSDENNFFEINNKTRNTSLGNFLLWNKEVQGSKIIFALSQLNESFNGALNIDSNNKLFLGNNNLLSQQYITNSNKYAFDAYLKNKNDIVNFNFHTGISYKKDVSDLDEIYSQTAESKSLKIYHYISDLNLSKKLGKFEFLASLSSDFLNINNVNKYYFQKRFQVKYSTDNISIGEFELEYSNKYNTPNLKLLQYNSLYTKDLLFFQNTSLTSDLLSKTDNYRFTWHRFNFEKGNNLFLMMIYNKIQPTFSTNTINYGTFSKIENTIGGSNDKFIFLIANDSKFAKNYTLKSKLTGMIDRASNFINNNANISTIKNFELSQKISTNFRNKPLQFDFGYSFIRNVFEQGFYDVSSRQDNVKLSLGIRSIIKKELIANVLGEYMIQKTDQNTLKNFLLGGQVSYRKEKSNFEYNLLFNNILNLHSFQYINSFTSQVGTDEVSTTALRGYITGGVKYNF